MSDQAFEEARVAIFDPVHQNRQATAVSLYEVGFRSIETPKSVDDLRYTLEQRLYDLLILEATAFQPEIMQVIKDIRQERMGDNVFSLILATSWTVDDVTFEQVLRAGADDLMKRPFSINQVGNRVAAFLRSRKPFFVSNEYIGPNHFDGALALSDGDLPNGRDVDVPNTLQGRTGPDRKHYNAPYEISRARASIKQALISLELEHMDAAVDALAHTRASVWDKIEEGLLPPLLLNRLDMLKRNAEKMAPLAEDAGLVEVARLTRAMTSILPQSAKVQTMPVKAVLALMPQMAKAIRLCVEPGNPDKQLAYEIIEKVDLYMASSRGA